MCPSLICILKNIYKEVAISFIVEATCGLSHSSVDIHDISDSRYPKFASYIHFLYRLLLGGDILPQLHITTFKLVSTKGDMRCFLGSLSLSIAPKWFNAKWSLSFFRRVSIKLLELFLDVSFFPLKRSQLYFYLCYIYPKLNVGAYMYSLMKRNILAKNIFQVVHDNTPLEH